ncbi:MAG: hypothetical protein LCI03_15355 [Actinobacteria bacterium]|nr:hypothetical protein [Actinomycetota bacterium]
MSERHPGWCQLRHEVRPDGGIERVLCVISENAGPHGESVVDWILSDVVSGSIGVPDEHHYIEAGDLGIGYYGFTVQDIARELDLLHTVFHLMLDSQDGRTVVERFVVDPWCTLVSSGRRWTSDDER